MNPGAGALDRRVALVKPGAQRKDAFGEVRHDAEIEIEVWAAAKDRGAGEGINGEMLAAETVRTYTFPWPESAEQPTERWGIREDGETWNIQNVLRSPRGEWMLDVQAIRKR